MRETAVVVIYTPLIWTISCWSFAPRGPRALNAFSIGKGRKRRRRRRRRKVRKRG